MSWVHVVGQKRHTQDGCQLVGLMKKAPSGKIIKAIDIGCGDGIISFEMGRLHRAQKILAVDISAAAVKAAKTNLSRAASMGHVEVRRVSAQSLFKEKVHWDSFDRFVINPPFFKSGSGRSNKGLLDQLARHEGTLNLKVWVHGARKILKTGGELYCVFPSGRLAELLFELSKNKIEPKEIWWLKDDTKKRRVFVRAVRGARHGVIIHFDGELKGVTQGQNA